MHTNPLAHNVPPQPQIQFAKRDKPELAYEIVSADQELLKRIQYHVAVPPQNEELDYSDGQAAPDAILTAVGKRDAWSYERARNASIDQRIEALQNRRHERQNELLQPYVKKIQPMPFDDIVIPESVDVETYRRIELGELMGSMREARAEERERLRTLETLDLYAA